MASNILFSRQTFPLENRRPKNDNFNKACGDICQTSYQRVNLADPSERRTDPQAVCTAALHKMIPLSDTLPCMICALIILSPLQTS